ncbi:MAG TPA: cysteine desulfurase family protein [Allosphingosinicella sp.]|nr:cysteine desulfurase family protein [Allosphingosinicella sp.]
MSAPIYLDYQATTPLAPEAAAAMRPWLGEGFANPHSSHQPGREAAAAVEVARGRVQAALGRIGERGKLHFTSGATEAANWALKGSAARLPANRRRIVTLATEHACVLDTVEWLGEQGFEVDVLPVRPDGLVDLARLDARLDERTGLVAAMLVNNEIGVIQPVGEIGAIARSRGARFFCDAVQGFGRVPVPLESCDMVALSGHKVHGPKGIGALWVRDGTPLDPLLHGGGQEGGLRSGTLSPALCAGFGEAARLLVERADEDHAHVEALWQAARSALPGWTLNGAADPRYHGNLNIRREGIDSARLISEIREIAFSAGSACASGSGRPSHVLAALGLTGREARSSIRLGFGRDTKEAELLRALALIDAAAGRQLSFAA